MGDTDERRMTSTEMHGRAGKGKAVDSQQGRSAGVGLRRWLVAQIKHDDTRVGVTLVDKIHQISTILIILNGLSCLLLCLFSAVDYRPAQTDRFLHLACLDLPSIIIG